MKIYCLLICFLIGIGSPSLSAQRVDSDCEAVEEVHNNLLEDAQVIAFRQNVEEGRFNIQSGGAFQDTQLQEKIYRSLAAVHNALNLTARTEVVINYDIHPLSINPKGISIYIDHDVAWREALFASGKSGFSPFDSLIMDYNLEIESYQLQTFGGWKLNLVSEDNLQFPVLLTAFKDLEGVSRSEVMITSGEANKDVAFASMADYDELTYRYSWGSCETGCAFNHFWRFKIYPDCSVEFEDAFGTPLAVAQLERLLDIQLFPNPSADLVNISLLGPTKNVLEMSLIDAKGQLIQSGSLDAKGGFFNTRISLERLPVGVYFLSFRNEDEVLTEKLLKR